MNNLKVKEIVARGYINPSKLPDHDYVINPYVGCPHACIYCYAEFMKRFTDHDEPWGAFTDVKIRSTATRPIDLRDKRIFLSSVTDCYNPLEEKYQVTRKLLQQLQFSGASKITILTKSALVTRDIDILSKMPNAVVGLSVNSLDNDFRKDIEPEAATPLERLYTLKTLHENGVKTWLHVAPVFPYLTDWKAILEAAAPFTDTFSFENLKLRAAALPRVMLYIHKNHPQLKLLYEQIFREYDMEFWRKLRKEILSFCNERKLNASVLFSEKEPREQF